MSDALSPIRKAMSRVASAAEVARHGTISEQNGVIAAAYDGLLAAREWFGVAGDGITNPPPQIARAIEVIENYRQKRDPANG